MDLAILFNLNTTYYKHVKHKKNIPGAVRSPGNLIFSNRNQKHYEEKENITWYSRQLLHSIYPSRLLAQC